MLATKTMLSYEKKQSYETSLSSSHDEDFRKCYKSYQQSSQTTQLYIYSHKICGKSFIFQFTYFEIKLKIFCSIVKKLLLKV